MFSLTLRYYSPRAYDYIRLKFDKNLPHPATIRKFYQQSRVQNESGICKRGLEVLSNLVGKLREEGKQLYCGLVFDEMMIRQHVQWLDHKKNLSGIVTFGRIADDSDSLPIATESLVFLVSGINVRFNLPIAYYLIAKLRGIDKVMLISSILKSLTDIGVNVLTITFDGLSSNISACEILGCSFEKDNMRPHFQNPGNTSTIHIWPDPPHMIKLVRKYLGNHRTIYDKDGRAIKWELFEKLVEMRDKENFVTHKMTKKHLDYSGKNGMKVHLAVQTLSNSVAKSMQFLLDKNHPGYEDAQATVEFTSRFDKLFDILNSEIQPGKNIYKNAITAESKDEIFQFLDETTHYIQNLYVKPGSKPMIECVTKVGLKGLLIAIQSVKSIYKDIVESGTLSHVSFRRVSQCPLESLFSRCRSHSLLGSNTNPTAYQFQSLFRKILVNNEITSSTFGNCFDTLDILHVSSTNSKKTTTQRNVHVTGDLNSNTTATSQAIELDDSFEEDAFEEEQHEYSLAPENVETGIAFNAARIERNIKSNLSCDLCATMFDKNEHLKPESFPDIGNCDPPCLSTYNICMLTHNVLESELLKIGFNYDKTVHEIISGFSLDSIFPKQSVFPHDHTHKSSIVKSIIEEYIKIRATEIARKISTELAYKRRS